MQENQPLPTNHDPSFTPPVTPLPAAESPTPKKNREGFKSVISTILIVVSAPIIALLLINFVFQSYEVDGPSMESTLQDGDRLIVWKVPRTIAKIQNNDYIPARGDVIVFTKKGLYEDGTGGDKQLIKRIIGLPGDRVVVSDGVVTIYNQDKPDGFVPDQSGEYEITQTTEGNVDITIDEGEVFVVGDNRANSLDSRVFGAISAQDIVGTLEFRIFPFQNFQQF